MLEAGAATEVARQTRTEAEEGLRRLGGERLLERLEEGSERRAPRTAAVAGPLTPREAEVLGLVADGRGDKEIAAALNLSEHTVHRHVSNILTKLAVPTRAAAVAEALRAGLI